MGRLCFYPAPNMTDDSEKLARIEEKLDALALRFDDFRVAVERRMTQLEVKAAFFGSLGGIAVGVGVKLLER